MTPASFVRRTNPDDHGILFAAVLLQAKRDAQYKGTNTTLLNHKRDAIRWIRFMDIGTVSFRSCCRALGLAERVAAKELLEKLYKGSRPWNGRSADGVEQSLRSARISSNRKTNPSPNNRRRGYVRCVNREASISSRRMTA